MNRQRKNQPPETIITNIWIARDPDYCGESYDDVISGTLRIFYEKPILIYDEKSTRNIWAMARQIAEVPSYMYPNIRYENSPAEFRLDSTSGHLQNITKK